MVNFSNWLLKFETPVYRNTMQHYKSRRDATRFLQLELFKPLIGIRITFKMMHLSAAFVSLLYLLPLALAQSGAWGQCKMIQPFVLIVGWF